MSPRRPEPVFSPRDLERVRAAVGVAEDRVTDFYKLSNSQWLRYRYDIRTLADLGEAEIVHGPFAQVIRYEARPADASLGSSAYDFYRICLQDHAILGAMEGAPELILRPFVLYIVTHELIHVVRFCKFLQQFDASESEKRVEEDRVHQRTLEILEPVRIAGMEAVRDFFRAWRERREPFESLR
jgi:hypothetical protein